MKLFKLLRNQSTTTKAPTLESKTWTRTEQQRMDRGRCVECGVHDAGETSFLCPACESLLTASDIKREIHDLKKRLLNQPRG